MDLLRQKILDGEYAEGERLPPERVLVEETRLTRAAVRNALGMLQQQGLIRTVAGRGGGSVVTRPTSGQVVSALRIFLQSQGWGPDHPMVLEMHEVIEPVAAALAADRRTDADTATLWRAHQKVVDAIDDIPTFVALSLSWHAAVADASKNVLLSVFLHARNVPSFMAMNSARYETQEARLASLRAHESVCAAIEARDANAAFEAMSTHLHGAASQIRTLSRSRSRRA